MAYERGKIFAMLTIVTGALTTALSVYVLASCEFYEVTWTTEFGVRRVDTPGLLVCKYLDSDKNPEFAGPKNTFDVMALVGAFGGALLGLVATVMVFNSYKKCLCRQQNTAVASFLFMMAVLSQGLTAIAIISKACGDDFDGKCKYKLTGWLSIGAAGGFFLASSFNRETAPKPGIPR